MSKSKPSVKELLEGVAQRGEPIPSGYIFDPRQHPPLSRRHRKPAEELAHAVGAVDAPTAQEPKAVDVPDGCFHDDADGVHDGGNDG